MQSRFRMMLIAGALVIAGAAAWFLRSDEAPPVAPATATPGPEDHLPQLIGAEHPTVEVPPSSEPGSEPAREEPKEPPVGVRHVVKGRVVDAEDGRPLAGARVRAMVGGDSWDLRSAKSGVVQTTVKSDGTYQLDLLLPALPADVIVTAELRGYQSPHASGEEGEEGEGGASSNWPMARVEQAGESTIDLSLRRGLDIRGVVVDSEGVSIEGVEIVAGENGAKWSSYLENTVTDARGAFVLYDMHPKASREAGAKGRIVFTHPEHVEAKIVDVYALDEAARKTLRVVMPIGMRVRGTLRHADGSLAKDLLVEAFRGKPNENHRGAQTDDQGRFEIVGLSTGPLVLRALSGAHLSFVRHELTLLRHEDDIELRLETGPLANTVKREKIFGIEFVAMPEEMRVKFEMYEKYVLLITNVTEEAPEELRKHARAGDVLWAVGRKNVTSRRDVMQGVVDRCDFFDKYRKLGGHPLNPMVSVGMLLGFRRDYMAGTNTQGIQIPRTEVEAMREWLANHPADD